MRSLLLVAALFVLSAAIVRAEDADAAEKDVEKDEAAGDAPAEDAATPSGPTISPFLIVHKTSSHAHAAAGTTIDVTVTALNVGNGPAFSVTLTDKPANGSPATTKAADELLPGDKIEISYHIVAGEAGSKIELDRALATYAAEKGSPASLKALSNLIRENERDETKAPSDLTDRGVVNVVTAAEYERLTSKRVLEMIVAVAFGASLVAFPFILFKGKQQQADKLLFEARKGK